jgi:hypothetical protein
MLAFTFDKVSFAVSSPDEGRVNVIRNTFESLANLSHVDKIEVVELPIILALQHNQLSK